MDIKPPPQVSRAIGLNSNNPQRTELNNHGNENVRDEIVALESVVEAFDSDRHSINKDDNQSNINIPQRRSQSRDKDKPGTQDIFQFIDKMPKVSYNQRRGYQIFYP
uniref:Uncharacterized protein n=1 Tax=Panagrolaimus davidi TaxID=227884 RepID=A0A914QTI8_9BILA